MPRTKQIAERALVAPEAALRPAGEVMSLRRAGAAVPSALSFARSAMRELVRGRWRIEKVRFDLDPEGRGEILYRLLGGFALCWTGVIALLRPWAFPRGKPVG